MKRPMTITLGLLGLLVGLALPSVGCRECPEVRRIEGWIADSGREDARPLARPGLNETRTRQGSASMVTLPSLAC